VQRHRLAVLHHHDGFFRRADVLQDISRHGDDVGELAGL
jgi:hypothetical protein